jgi:hypothetical protein
MRETDARATAHDRTLLRFIGGRGVAQERGSSSVRHDDNLPSAAAAGYPEASYRPPFLMPGSREATVVPFVMLIVYS